MNSIRKQMLLIGIKLLDTKYLMSKTLKPLRYKVSYVKDIKPLRYKVSYVKYI